jgi:hypothetical protein
MSSWSYYELSEVRRGELLREAERGRLVKMLREGERALEGSRAAGEIEVRWGLLKDEPRIAELLELNGMPRWIAFEERHIVAEKEGVVLAALRYRMEPKRLVLGLLVADPWVEERPLAVAMYTVARELAQEIGAREVRAWAHPHLEYPREAGYRRRGKEWRVSAARAVAVREALPTKGWLRIFGAWGVPLFGLPRKHE